MAKPKKPAKRRAAKKRTTSIVPVKVDRRRREKYQQLLGTMKASRREEAAGYDDYWEAVGDILDDQLWIAGGYGTEDAFIRGEIPEPPRTALRHVRVARYATATEEAKYGAAMIDVAIAYIEAKTGGTVRGRLPVKLDRLRIPVERDGKSLRVTFPDATFDEVATATRALRRGKGAARKRASPVEQAILGAVKGIRSLAGITIDESRGRVRIGHVPVGALGDLGRALGVVRLPGA